MLAAFVVGATIAANNFCNTNFQADPTKPGFQEVVKVEGKMNVPILPRIWGGQVTFLWPGTDTSSDMMQPVLTYNELPGLANKSKWLMNNWFCSCPGYCHDTFTPVEEGDTLLFSFTRQRVVDGPKSVWHMTWSSYNDPSLSSTFETNNSRYVYNLWVNEAEFYFDPNDPAKSDQNPQSPYYTWDVVVTDVHGASVPVSWQATGAGTNKSEMLQDCHYKHPDPVWQGKTIARQTYPGNYCPDGQSRAYLEACKDECGCLNKIDGTHKISCDFCCAEVNGKCVRSMGPYWSRNSTDTTYDAVPPQPNTEVTRPGVLARSQL